MGMNKWGDNLWPDAGEGKWKAVGMKKRMTQKGSLIETK